MFVYSVSSFSYCQNCNSSSIFYPNSRVVYVHSAVSRAPISAPPGFSVPSRAPPPGFASHERVDQAFDSLSGELSLILCGLAKYLLVLLWQE